MPSPFPGMDPYLEKPGLWQQVHTDLIVDIRRFLAPRLRPHYHVAIEQNTYLTVLPPSQQRVGIPDVTVVTSQKSSADPAVTAVSPVVTIDPLVAELPQPEKVKHRYLEVRDTETQQVITTIEILSPANKIGREGRDQYERKRFKVLGSLTNLVEIDLLRNGQPMPMNVPFQKDYRVVISRSHHRPQADIYLFSVRDAIPNFPIPLQPNEEEISLPLNQLLYDLYDKGSYDLVINYQEPPTPPLSDEDMKWATTLQSLPKKEEEV